MTNVHCNDHGYEQYAAFLLRLTLDIQNCPFGERIHTIFPFFYVFQACT